MLPNFFVVGTQKGGTTSLHKYLVAHPDIYLPAQKETKFFVDDERFRKGIKYYEAQHFSAWNGEAAVGEVDPDYMYFECALERMAELIDVRNTKFIFLFRNPVERAFSHYLMTYRRGVEPLSFEDALDREPERICKDYLSNMHYSYAARGYYADQVARFLGRVDVRNMLFLLSDDLVDDPASVLARVFHFLGVDATFHPENLGVRYHQSTAPRSMSLLRRIEFHDGLEKRLLRALLPQGLRRRLRQGILDLNQGRADRHVLNVETRRMLSARFTGANARLEECIGRSLSHWNAARTV